MKSATVFRAWIDLIAILGALSFHLSDWPARPASLQIERVTLKGWSCKILKNNHSENGTRYFEEL